MIKAENYLEKVSSFFSFLEDDFGFNKVNETIDSNIFYDVEYGNNDLIISISYENLEEYLEVIVFKLLNGKMPDYDDKTNTLHLNKLNTQVMSKVDKETINGNNKYFSNFNVENEFERELIKKAKELRICLKYYDNY